MKRNFVFGIAILSMVAFLLSACSGGKKVKQPPAETKKETKAVETPVVKAEDDKPAPEEKPKKQISLRDINFDFDKYDLRSDALAILSEHVRDLKAHPEIKVVIEGHCDEWGSAEYNLALGERRASAVKNYLVKSGISADRISTISYGKEKPLDPRSTREAWAKNRRAAFVLKG